MPVGKDGEVFMLIGSITYGVLLVISWYLMFQALIPHAGGGVSVMASIIILAVIVIGAFNLGEMG